MATCVLRRGLCSTSSSGGSALRLAARADMLQRRLQRQHVAPKPPKAMPADAATAAATTAAAAAAAPSPQQKEEAWHEAQASLRSTVHETRRAPRPHELAVAADAFAFAGRSELAAAARVRCLAYGATERLAPETSDLLLRSSRYGDRDETAALHTWQALQAMAAWPTAPGLLHLLAACARGGKWHAALDALRVAQAPPPEGGGMAPNIRHYNTVLKALVTAGELRQAENLLDGIIDGTDAVDADTVSFNTLLHGYRSTWADGEAAEARIERAEALLARMDAMGVERNEFTYNALIDVCQYHPDRVLGLLVDAKRDGAATLSSYTKAAASLCWAGRVDQARELAESMRQAGVEPDAAFYARVIEAAEDVALLDDADKLHREACERGLGDALNELRGGGGGEVRLSTPLASAAAAAAEMRGSGAPRRKRVCAAAPKLCMPLTASMYTGCGCEICRRTL